MVEGMNGLGEIPGEAPSPTSRRVRPPLSSSRQIAADIAERLGAQMRRRDLRELGVPGVWGVADIGRPLEHRYVAYDELSVECESGVMTLRLHDQGRPVDAPAVTTDQPAFCDLVIEHAAALLGVANRARHQPGRVSRHPALELVSNAHLARYTRTPPGGQLMSAADISGGISARLINAMRALGLGRLRASGVWGVVAVGRAPERRFVAFDTLELRSAPRLALLPFDAGQPCLPRGLAPEDPVFQELLIEHAPALFAALNAERTAARARRLSRSTGR